MISGIAFDRPDGLINHPIAVSRSRSYMILPIVHIELNSIQPIDRGRSSQSSASFAIIWVAFSYDCPDHLNII